MTGAERKMSVDEFVMEKILPQFHPVVAMIRDLMKECAPEAKESVSYGMPVFKTRNIITYISPSKKDITFSFIHGVEFEDRYGMLKGRGKAVRHVKLKSVDAANMEALRYYIAQALEFDTK